MTDGKDEEYRIIDDEQPKMQFNGKGFKVVVKSVTTAVSNVDPERDVTGFFRDANGRCLICELCCTKDDCTKCEVPAYSQIITTRVMEKITSHKATPVVKMEKISKPQ